MSERSVNLQDIEWRELFQFTRIFRAFRIAIRPSKLLLAMAALLCMYLGGRALDFAWPQKFVDEGYKIRSGAVLFGAIDKPFASFAHEQLNHFKAITDSVIAGDWSYPGGVPNAIADFMLITPLKFWRGNQLFFSLFFAWFLVVWAFFGGAIARIAAIHVARDEVISPWRAMRFSLKAFPSFLAAPLIPFIMVLILGLLISLMGLLLYIPFVGPIATGLLLIVPLILGVVMMLLTVGTIAGSGLMYPTLAVEGSDAFDAVSRVLSHVFASPWRLLFYTAIATLYGAITYVFVRICVFVMLWMVHFFVGWFVVGQSHDLWLAMWPEPSLAKLAYSPAWETLTIGGKAGAGIASFWVYLTMSLLGAFVISFYFSSSTIIYLLMRRKVDATEMDQVYLEPADEQLPLTPAAVASDAAAAPASSPAEPSATGNPAAPQS